MFGAHISISQGIDKAPKRAHNLGCGCFQIFTRSPQGGSAVELTPELVKNFNAECRKYHLKNFYIHTPYFINLASSKNNIFFGSISAIKKDLERASQLGAKYVMTHLGSANDFSYKQAIKKTIQGLVKILKDYQGSAQFLIEIAAGSGKILGSNFEEIKTIIKKTECQLRASKSLIGVCFDTAHAFASGYDLRDKEKVDEVICEFDQVLGLDRLKLIHLNDSKTELDSHKDRHAHLGKGQIGLKGIKAIVKHSKLKKLDFILETLTREGVKKDLELLESWRK